MASGILGISSPAATTNTTVYTVPGATLATVNINLCNRGTTDITVRLALSATGTPATTEYIEYDVVIAPAGVLERTGIVLNATKNIVAYTSAATLSVVVYGIEGAV